MKTTNLHKWILLVLAALVAVVLAGCNAEQPPVYDAGGTADRSVNSDALAALLADAQGKVVLASDLKEAETILRTHAPAVGAIVTAGARDPGLPVLARRLIQQGKE